MKRIWRYLKWTVKGMGLFEWWMATIWFFMGGGIAATVNGDEQLKNMWFALALISAGLGVLFLMFKGFQHSWNSFKEDDEKVFNILKDKHDGQ